MRSIKKNSSSSTSSTDSSNNYQNHRPPLEGSSDNYHHHHQHNLSISGSNISIMRTSSDHLPIDLRLGLSSSSTNTSVRHQSSHVDWPPIKTLLRRALITAAEGEGDDDPGSPLSSSSSTCNHTRQISNNSDNSLFVKVKMEGLNIGRKIDVLALHGYPHLITTLEHMFSTPNILWARGEHHNRHYIWTYVLTYEDQDGDWMMVGDVPWEMFLTTVKRLKINYTHIQ